MKTVIGDLFFLLFGSQDFMIVAAAYLTVISILYSILASWKYGRS